MDDSTVAVALWALTNDLNTPKLDLVLDNVVSGGVGVIKTKNPAWTSRSHLSN